MTAARIAFDRPEMRASDADRESFVRLLNDAFTEADRGSNPGLVGG